MAPVPESFCGPFLPTEAVLVSCDAVLSCFGVCGVILELQLANDFSKTVVFTVISGTEGLSREASEEEFALGIHKLTCLISLTRKQELASTLSGDEQEKSK